ncbi:MAG TPA: hypothetical protein VJR89_11830 [Polyangiales bacterium]|nr:hypothetical protein [Polyangiales bacterium]
MIRKILISTSLCLSLACGGEATTAPAAATTTPGTSPQYQIVLHRPLSVGDRFRVQVEAKQHVTGAIETSDAQQAASKDVDKNMELSLVGLLTIREVDEVGRALSALLDIEQFKSGDKEVLPTGTRIDAVRGAGKFSMMVNGTPRPDVQKQLELAFPLHRPGSPLGDELFGSKEPRQVGDTWTFSKSAVSQELLDEGYVVRETAIEGNTRLQGVTRVNGADCLELTSKMQADQATVGEQWDMQGVGAGKLDVTIKLVVPVDTKLPLAMEEATSTGAFQGALQDGTGADKVGLTLTRYRRALYTKMAETPK